MGKLVGITTRTLSQSSPTPTTVTFNITAINKEAQKTRGNGHVLLLEKIMLQCNCTGEFSPTQTYQGTGNSEITVPRLRVRCEGAPLLLDGDEATIHCTGVATDKSSGSTTPANASVKVTITDSGQIGLVANTE